MNFFRAVIITCVLWLLTGASAISAGQEQLGVVYGKEFRGNTDLSQIEFFYRMPLSYEKDLGDVWKLSTALEFAEAVISDSDSETSSTGRVSVMPQMMLSPNDRLQFLFGFGTGVMVGETEFPGHNLGGMFFFSSKVGIQFILGKHFGLEYNFYHQSNAGFYDYNASLNMNQVVLSYRF